MQSETVKMLRGLEAKVERLQLDVNILRVGLQNINREPKPTFEAAAIQAQVEGGGRLYAALTPSRGGEEGKGNG